MILLTLILKFFRYHHHRVTTAYLLPGFHALRSRRINVEVVNTRQSCIRMDIMKK